MEKKLYRDMDNKMLCGVCAGVGEYFKMDVSTVRLLLVLFVILAAILCMALSICLITASKGRLAKSKLALHDVVIPEDAAESNDLNYFIGREGVTHTALRPSGIGEFDGVKLNVVSDGEFINKDVPIRVLSVKGNRIVVCELKDKQ